jgi:hypothetical protein
VLDESGQEEADADPETVAVEILDEFRDFIENVRPEDFA